MAAVTTLAMLPLLSGPVDAAVFSNSTPIQVPRPNAPPGCPTFPAPNNSCPPTSATPYPSTISVAGEVGTVTDVNVTLNDLTYSFWDGSDLDVMLVAPNGSSVMLMSDACGDSASNAALIPITQPIDLTFDDAAASGLPQDAACFSGTFDPTDDDNDENFQFTANDVFCGPPTTPGSCPPAGAPPTTNNTLLSTFNGIDPNGTWSLYVVDDTPSDPGATPGGGFAGGWTLEILTTGPPTTTSTTTTLAPTTTSSTTTSTTTPSPTTTSTSTTTPSPTTTSTSSTSSTTTPVPTTTSTTTPLPTTTSTSTTTTPPSTTTSTTTSPTTTSTSTTTSPTTTSTT
ncbi:MAG: hypothetical protein LC708_02400, partial [Actinobacteria bacterium]|nr:hypothetical protein [Actinomycetota bacterium]